MKRSASSDLLLQDQGKRPTHALQYGSPNPLVDSYGALDAAVAAQASWGSMSAAEPKDTAAWLPAAGAVKLEPGASSMQSDMLQQRACSSGAAGMSVSDLKAVLTRVCADKQEVRAHMVPVRYLAKLLHGPDVDHSTVQLVTLLPQVGVLLSHMHDRVAGTVQGKEAMAPHKAAAHAAALQRVLSCAEVQAELGQQQVSQLLAAVGAAEQVFEAAEWQVSSYEQAAPASTGEEGYAAAGVAAASGEETGVGSTGQQGAEHSLSVAQLLVEAQTMPGGWAGTALRKLLLLAHGPQADPAAVQVADLLPQWPLLQAHLLQRVEGKGEEPPLKPNSAHHYTQGIVHCLALPSVRSQFDAAALAALQQQLQDSKIKLSKIKPKSMSNGTALATDPSPATGAAAAAGLGAEGAAAAAAADDRLRRGAAAGGLSVARLLDALRVSSFSTDTASKTQTTISKLLLLVHGPGADAAAVQAASLLQHWPVLCADLQQRVSGPKPSMKLKTANKFYVASVLRVLRMPQVQAEFDSTVLEQLQRQVKADRAAYFPRAGKGRPRGETAGSKGTAAHSKSESAGSDAAAGRSESDPENVSEGQHEPRSEGLGQGAGSDGNNGMLGAVDQQLQTMTLGQLKGTVSSDHRVAINGVAKAAGFDEASRDSQPLPAVLQAQHVEGFLRALRERGCSAAHITNMTRYLRYIVSLRTDVQCCLGPGSVQQLQQALELAAAQQAPTESVKAASSKGGPASLPTNDHDGCLPDAQAKVAKAAVAAAAASSSQPAGQRLLRSAGQSGAAVPVSAQDATTADSNAAYAGQWPVGFNSAATTAAAAQQPAAGAVSAQASGLLAPAAAGPSQGAPPLADAPVHNLPTAQRQLLRLYADKLSPSLAEKLALRSTLQMLAGLPPGDIRLDRFFADYDWVVMLSEETESTPQHWRDAFDTLMANATRGP